MSASPDAGASTTPAVAAVTPPRLPLTSADPLAPRYDQLKALFPMAVTDGRVDMEKLRALMGEHAASGPERYGLSWAGKSDALKALRQLTTATLLPAPSESEKWETTGNAIIEGDNLEVLKVLQHAYHGKVKLEPATAAGTTVFRLDEGKLVICLARELTREILRATIELKPQSVLCLDVGFKGNDSLKVNAQLEFQSHGIQFRTA